MYQNVTTTPIAIAEAAIIHIKMTLWPNKFDTEKLEKKPKNANMTITPSSAAATTIHVSLSFYTSLMLKPLGFRALT